MVKNKSHMKRLAQNLFVLSVVAGLPATSYAAESLDQLATRIGMDHFRDAIKKVTAALSKHCRQKATKTALPDYS